MTERLAWLLDANVVSEMMRPRPEPRVAAFLDSIAEARNGLSAVTVREITEHRHGAIAMLTLDDVHHGRAHTVLQQREQTLHAAWTHHPDRFVRGIPNLPPPEAVWIDPPAAPHNRRDCSANRSRRCLKVVDRFREAYSGPSAHAARLPRRLALSSSWFNDGFMLH